MRVLGNKVAVYMEPVPERQGSLYVAPSAKTDQIIKSAIITVGPEVTDVKAGDTVYVNQFTSHKVVVGGVTYLVLPVTEILAVLDGK